MKKNRWFRTCWIKNSAAVEAGEKPALRFMLNMASKPVFRHMCGRSDGGSAVPPYASNSGFHRPRDSGGERTSVDVFVFRSIRFRGLFVSRPHHGCVSFRLMHERSRAELYHEYLPPKHSGPARTRWILSYHDNCSSLRGVCCYQIETSSPPAHIVQAR